MRTDGRILLSLFVSSLLAVAPLAACECGVVSADGKVAPSDIWTAVVDPSELVGRQVFRGIVKSIHEVAWAEGAGKDVTYAQEVTFRVTKTWAGAVSREFVLHQDGSMCSPSFEVGQDYVVFASAAGPYLSELPAAPDPIFTATICDRTTTANGNEKLIEQLDRVAPAIEAQSLCTALAQVGPGEKLHVTVTGILESGFEIAPFYDPKHPSCEWNVSPSTCLRFQDGFGEPKKLDSLLERDGRVMLTVRGVLSGPGAVGADNPDLPLNWAYAKRVGTFERYCHAGWQRTQLIVTEILDVQRVPRHTPRAGAFHAERKPTLAVQSASLFAYPPRARLVGITGDVVVRATVKQGVVTNVSVVSGDRELSAAAVENVNTWTFLANVNTEFTSTFSFRLELRKTAEGDADRLELALPGSVKIFGAMNGW